MKSLIQSVEVTYLVHETEDQEKLGRAAAELVGAGSVPEAEPLEGHFSNKITRARIHIVGDEAESAARKIFEAMSKELRQEILSGIRAFVDEHSALYLRFDKQLLVQGTLALGSGDSVRVKVKPRLFQAKGSAPEFYGRLLEGGRAT
ncbi:MAG: hypothetical protein KGI26_01140 [Thaumarchaeota archaeon]|nr:hypothetical protein [Nitrososphaerota archaeon]